MVGLRVEGGCVEARVRTIAVSSVLVQMLKMAATKIPNKGTVDHLD